ncbi:MAG: hypothetical protein AAFR87_20030 [Bacteroidota bacterium]
MAYTAQTPIVYLACVNSFRSGKRIRYLVKQRKIIQNILSFSRQKPLFEPVIKDPSANSYFFDYLNKNYDLDRIRVLHFMGEAESEHLRVESGKAETSLHVNELSKFIALLPNLELVFLHGCATPKLLDMLVRRDVPAIMVCETQSKDKRSMDIASTFYEEISRGASVQKALLSVQEVFPQFGSFKLDYEVESDDIAWPVELEAGKIPWGLYYLSEHESRLYEPISHRDQEGISLPISNYAKLGEEDNSSVYRFAAIAAVITFILALIYFGQNEAGGLSNLLAF